jgi:hypothetical protein
MVLDCLPLLASICIDRHFEAEAFRQEVHRGGRLAKGGRLPRHGSISLTPFLSDWAHEPYLSLAVSGVI